MADHKYVHDVWPQEVEAHAKAEIKTLEDHAKTDGGMEGGFIGKDVLKKLQEKGNFTYILLHCFFGGVLCIIELAFSRYRTGSLELALWLVIVEFPILLGPIWDQRLMLMYPHLANFH